VTIVQALRETARRRPDHPALLSAGKPAAAILYGELVERMDAWAARLRRSGVRPGDRCGLVARQGAGFVERALGILAADGCLVPIPDDHRGAVLEAFAARARLHHLLREEGEPELSTLPAPAPVDGAGDAEFRALRPAYLRFTSGTTSRRKGVILGHDAITARLDRAAEGLRIGPDDRILWLLPMAHHFVVSILLYLRSGATVLLPASPLARPVLELGEREGATVLYASPHHFRLLAKDASGLRLPALRLAISTAESLRGDVAERFAARFGRWPAQALGIIEVGLPVANLASAASKPGALGRPLPGYDVWLRDDDGRPLPVPTPPGRSGEICIRGPGLLDAYLDPWLPAAKLLGRDGFRTGDQGVFDADGDLFLVGRRRSRISMAGMKFFAEEVEPVLESHPGVAACRVSGREHAQLGQIPVAEIVPADPGRPPSRGELLAFCRERLPRYQIPRELRVVESLPRTATGKVRRAGD